MVIQGMCNIITRS